MSGFRNGTDPSGFPELKDVPYLWQPKEHVISGGSSYYMFLVLAADQVLHEK